MKLFDTHAHYDDPKFDIFDRDRLLTELFAGNICAITGASVNLTTAKAQLAFAERYPGFYAAVGIHPENLYDDGTDMNTVLSRVEEMLSHPKVVAIGEIGLDYYWEQNPPREVQKEWFHAQMELAAKSGYPVIIHDRDAHGDVFDILRSYPTVRGILHSCSASGEMVKELVKRGWYISFSGVITYKNATKIAEVVKIVPDDRILVETDCPYLSPVPMRGKVNRSDYMEYTLRRAAEIRGVDPEELARQTVENAKRIFRIGQENLPKNKTK